LTSCPKHSPVAVAERNEIPERFGRRLRELRAERGLSQEGLAARAGLDRTYISGVERGSRNISLSNVGRLAKALGVRLQDLLKGVDP
jgi:transcriptional regulator with XRE-family HTH domain